MTSAECKTIFEGVLNAYVEIRKERVAVIAINWDRDPSANRSRRLTVKAIEFCVDTEQATQKALKGDLKLETIWWELAIDETPSDPKLAEEVIRRCGYIYSKHNLQPERYFAVKKKGGL